MLCVCTFCGLFSVSAFAQGVELTVDGESQDIIYLDENISTYAVVSGYSYSLVCTEPLNGATVNGPIVSSTASRGISLLLRITLSSEISKNTYFDIRLQYNSDEFGSITSSLYAYDKEYANACGSGVSFTGEHIASKKYIDFLEVGGTKRGVKYLEIYIALNDVSWTDITQPEPEPEPEVITKRFKVNNTYFEYVDGMTFGEWINSKYNTAGFYLDGCIKVGEIGYVVQKKAYNTAPSSFVQSSDLIDGSWVYYTNATEIASLDEYQFSFSVSSITINTMEDEKVSGGILGWVKSIFNGIINLPSNIASKISSFFSELGNKISALGDKILDGIKSLFIPSEESITELKGKFEQLLSDRFGAVYESAAIIDNFASAFFNTAQISLATEQSGTIKFPLVEISLAGTVFSFGGWDVDLIPDNFEGIVEMLKILIDVVCTFVFVNALRKKLEALLA